MMLDVKPARILLAASLLACAALPARASEEEAFTHALNLVQMFVHAAAQTGDPNASLRMMDDVLAGRNTQANRAFAGLMEEATAGMSSAQRDQIASIGRDLAAAARKEAARPAVASADAALQARKDLTAMGLRYYDPSQFLDAVKRGDTLAVDLFVAGKGLDPALIARSLPAGR
jgi:hypothetical protein